MSAATVVVPQMIPVARPYIGPEEEAAVVGVLRSGWISQGPRVAEFEEAFARFVGAEHAVAMSSCTTALHLAMCALGIGPGDEVICPSLSFIATANAIAYTGATPIFVDVDPQTYNLNPAAIEAAISPSTKAILAVHQIGLPAEMTSLAAIASDYGLALIEDAACAIGSEYEGRRIGGSLGTMACFSFHPRKILTTGEGGMITLQDRAMAERLRRLRQHAMSLSDVARHSAKQISCESYDEVGFNYRMTDMQAVVGLEQLRRLDELLARRRYLAARYTDGLQALPWLQLPTVPANCHHNYQSYMVRLTGGMESERDALMQYLLERQISTRRAVMAIHHEAPYRSGRWTAHLPETDRIARSGLILPLYHQLSEAEQDYVIDCLQDFYRDRLRPPTGEMLSEENLWISSHR
jgi:dTDP-4-amino-4,6-dideoxygalactose transaminase